MNVLAPTIVLYSYAPDRSVRFYERLGLSFKKERHGKGPVHYACDLGAAVIEFYPTSSTLAPLGLMSGHRLVLPVDDLSATLRRIARAKNGAVLVPPKDTARGRSALVADPDGRHVLLLETKNGS